MKTSKNEQNKKHSRFSYSIRSICFTLICSLILCTNCIYANTINTDVGQGTYDSIIVNNDGTIDHTATTNFRGIISNIVSFLQRINRNEYQNGTYLATIYTYFSSALSDLRTYSQNTAAASNASLTFLGSIETLLKQQNQLIYFDSNTYHPSFQSVTNSSASWNNNTIEWTGFNGTAPANLTYVLTSTSSDKYNIISMDITSPYSLTISPFLNGVAGQGYTINGGNRQFHLVWVLNHHSGSATAGFSITSLGNLNSSSVVKISNIVYSYDPQLDALYSLQDLEVNVEINDSINVTPIDLDVQIGIDDFTAVNSVSNKLRLWLSTGVGVVDLIAALDELDDTFFTLHNRSVIETISTGYTDYYD